MDERDEQRLLDMIESTRRAAWAGARAGWAGAASGWISAIVAITALVALILLAT